MNKKILMLASIGLAPLIAQLPKRKDGPQANINLELSDKIEKGAEQLKSAVETNGNLDQIVPQLTKMYDQLLSKKALVQENAGKIATLQSTLKNLRKTVETNKAATDSLKTSLFASIDNLLAALTSIGEILAETQTSIDQTVAEKNTHIQSLSDKIKTAHATILEGNNSLYNRMMSLSKTLSTFGK